MTEKPNKVVFAWVRDQGRLVATKFPDPDYLKYVKGKRSMIIVAENILSPDEQKLSIQQLANKYPAPSYQD